MFGLKGNNVKLSSKPPLPPGKGKLDSTRSSNNGKNGASKRGDSFISGVSESVSPKEPRRTHSASTLAGYKGKSGKGVRRKESEPLLVVAGGGNNKSLARAATARNLFTQNRRKTSTEEPDYLSIQQTGRVELPKPRKPPFSFSTDEEEFNCEEFRLPPGSRGEGGPFPTRPDNPDDVQVLTLEIEEHAEELTTYENILYFDEGLKVGGEMAGNSGKEGTGESRQRELDEKLIADSDNLIRDVVNLCDDMGLDSSLLQHIKRSSNLTDNPLESPRRELNYSPPNFPSSSRNSNNQAWKGKSSFSPPQCYSPGEGSILGESFQSPMTPSGSGRGKFGVIEFGPNQGSSEHESARRPTEEEEEGLKNNSFTSPPPPIPESRTDEAAYARILETLRMIEEEEKKGSPMAAHIADYLRKKSPPLSPDPVFSISSMEGSCSISSRPDSRDSTRNVMSPRLPPIEPSCGCTSRGNPFQNDHISSGRKNYKAQSSDHNHPNSIWPGGDEKTRNIFSFLDQVEKSDRETLFNIKFDTKGSPREVNNLNNQVTISRSQPEFSASSMDNLIRKGSVELARDVLVLDRKLEQTTASVSMLEETLLSQRELNVRNLRNAEKDLKKRLRLQQEEFELALSRHQAFVDQLIGEKRALQDKCEKVLRSTGEMEQRFQAQIKSLQEKHLDELKRMRKMQENAEKARKHKWVGAKTQEIRELTVKGLEPEVQRIIQRHQQEMSEMRAWHGDEMREIEERCQRKLNMQLQEMREKLTREKDEACEKERETILKRLESDYKLRGEELEAAKKRLMTDLSEERARASQEEIKLRDSFQEILRKSQIKSEVELENLREEQETKVKNMERKHENELKSLKDVYEAQREAWASNEKKKFEAREAERDTELREILQGEKEKEVRDREKKLRDDFEATRRLEEEASESKFKRIQEKFQSELRELEKSESELKQKVSQVKAELLTKEEEIFGLKTSLNLKEKQNGEMSEANLRMLEERANLTGVIRREFNSQMEILEDDCRSLKASVVELKAKHKFESEVQAQELEKLRGEKDAEIEKIGCRVKQALGLKEEAIHELQKQLEKAQIRINHLEELMETQRRDFLKSLQSSQAMGKTTTKNVTSLQLKIRSSRQTPFKVNKPIRPRKEFEKAINI